MEVVNYVMIAFAVLAAIDRIAGNKLGMGREFEKGIEMIGLLALAMVGVLVMTPLIAHGLRYIADFFPNFFDFSIVPATFLANDSGGAHLAMEVANSEEIGYFNGLVVASMMGATVSIAIPFAMQLTKEELHKDILFGIICGIITIPTGCVVAGIMMGIGIPELIKNMIPLIIFSLICTVGLLKFEKITIRIFNGIGLFMKAIITVGLIAGIIEFLTGTKILPYIDTLENSMKIIISIMCVIAGAFPLVYLLKKVLKKPLEKLGEKLGINDTAAFGFLTSAANYITTFDMMKRMDKKGVVLNSAFLVSASFAFVDHMAFTMSFKPEYTLHVVIGKLISGVSAVVLANILVNKRK